MPGKNSAFVKEPGKTKTEPDPAAELHENFDVQSQILIVEEFPDTSDVSNNFTIEEDLNETSVEEDQDLYAEGKSNATSTQEYSYSVTTEELGDTLTETQQNSTAEETDETLPETYPNLTTEEFFSESYQCLTTEGEPDRSSLGQNEYSISEEVTETSRTDVKWQNNIYDILQHTKIENYNKTVKKRLWNTVSLKEFQPKEEEEEKDEETHKEIKRLVEEKESITSSASEKETEIPPISIAAPDYITAQEPWPKDVKLYQPYEVEQILLPDNANCLAVQAFLRMCNLDFQVESRANAEFMSPSGKVPFIKCGAFVIPELEGIVQFVNNKGISLTTNLEPDQRSDMRAYMSLVHNVLENAELYLCWCDKETYNEVTKPRNGSVYPWPLNYFQTWSKKTAVCKRLKVMGWYEKSLEDVYQEVENCCHALSDRLEEKEYFFGKSYTEMDALIYGHIYSALTTPLPANHNKLAFIIKSYDGLINHCRKIDKQVMNREHHLLVGTYSAMTVPQKPIPTEIEDIDDYILDSASEVDEHEKSTSEIDSDDLCIIDELSYAFSN